ncbi:hypothetical protein YA0002_09305 [Pseudomonas cichorii]|uniref:hypothetical protein n=1 Tax=Pseudomonas cichorii TaxID=36746 RepID=UPI0018E61F8C|nr:hypothetical protein [Pseudomonas cichorii]MBI6852962.1 hypothetical protein [Pseudomonas cichorii]
MVDLTQQFADIKKANALNTANALLSKDPDTQKINSILKSTAFILTKAPTETSPTAVDCLKSNLNTPKGLEIDTLEGNAISLNVTGAASDRHWYVFHYSAGSSSVPGTTGTGSCIVPYDAPIGTAVISGGFCGCTAHIDKTTKGLMFTHDSNGKHLTSPLNGTTRVASISYKDYCSSGNIVATEKFTPTHIGSRTLTTPTIVAATLIFLKISNTSFITLCSSYLSGFAPKPRKKEKGFFSKIFSSSDEYETIPSTEKFINFIYLPDPLNSKVTSTIDNIGIPIENPEQP